MALLSSRSWLRLAVFAVAVFVLVALAYGLRVRVVGDPPRGDQVRVIDAPTATASVPSSAAATLAGDRTGFPASTPGAPPPGVAPSATNSPTFSPSIGGGSADVPAPAPSSTEREPDIEAALGPSGSSPTMPAGAGPGRARRA